MVVVNNSNNHTNNNNNKIILSLLLLLLSLLLLLLLVVVVVVVVGVVVIVFVFPGIRCADHATPIRKSWHYFANKRRSLGRHSSLAARNIRNFTTFSCSFSHCPSARCVSGANAVCKSTDIFSKSCLSLKKP
jgi:hypothetical protein